MGCTASLIEDGGAAASDAAEFFRAPAFMAAEGVTHSLELRGDGWREALPLIVRPIEGSDRVDAISPYGYPGATDPPESPPAPDAVDWSATGLVSVFVRDRIGGAPCLAGGSERAQVRIADPGRESGVRKRLAQQIRRNERRGWAIESRSGAEVSEADLLAFERAYSETMARADAAERYRYPRRYFAGVLMAERCWLLLAARGEEAPGAGVIAAVSDGYLHYYLGGTADSALQDSPMKNLFAAMIDLANELGVPLHLGGGVRPGDSLDEFKRGFANATEPFLTHEVVCDREAYDELSSGVGGSGGFFPAYRAA